MSFCNQCAAAHAVINGQRSAAENRNHVVSNQTNMKRVSTQVKYDILPIIDFDTVYIVCFCRISLVRIQSDIEGSAVRRGTVYRFQLVEIAHKNRFIFACAVVGHDNHGRPTVYGSGVIKVPLGDFGAVKSNDAPGTADCRAAVECHICTAAHVNSEARVRVVIACDKGASVHCDVAQLERGPRTACLRVDEGTAVDLSGAALCPYCIGICAVGNFKGAVFNGQFAAGGNIDCCLS